MDHIIKDIENINIDLETNVDLSQLSYMKTGGKAYLLIKPGNTQQLSDSIKLLNQHEITYKVIGATSNLLFLDNTNYSCLLSTRQLTSIELDNNEIIVGSGFMLPDLSKFALYNSITNYEGFEGIPGTIGGAVFMNAGAYGYEIKNVLEYVEVVDCEGNVKYYSTSDLNFSKRHSAFRTKEIEGIITKAIFIASTGDVSQIERKMEIYHSKRHKYQDFLFPNLGSMFSGSIYRSLGKYDKYTNLLSFLFYLFNYKFKIFRRDSPINRKWINDIVVKRFNLKYERQPFSNKTINCLVNRGQGTDEMVRYITEMKGLLHDAIPLENEIVEKF